MFDFTFAPQHDTTVEIHDGLVSNDPVFVVAEGAPGSQNTVAINVDGLDDVAAVQFAHDLEVAAAEFSRRVVASRFGSPTEPVTSPLTELRKRFGPPPSREERLAQFAANGWRTQTCGHGFDPFSVCNIGCDDAPAAAELAEVAR